MLVTGDGGYLLTNNYNGELQQWGVRVRDLVQDFGRLANGVSCICD
jgi:hypothetical protein